jgi:TIR domain
LRDVKRLRSGQLWNEELLAFIRDADVFQLFWSQEAAASKYVEQEWRSALKERENRGDPFFLRPVYWTQAPAPIPSELSRLHFARIAIGD